MIEMAIDFAAWVTVVIGAVLSYWCVRSTLYFHRQVRLLPDNWVISAFHRIALTITAASIWLTLARVLTLLFGPLSWLGLVSSFFIIWLLLVPLLMQRLFEKHEGK